MMFTEIRSAVKRSLSPLILPSLGGHITGFLSVTLVTLQQTRRMTIKNGNRNDTSGHPTSSHKNISK